MEMDKTSYLINLIIIFPPKTVPIKRGHSPFEKTNPKDLQGCSKLAAGLGTSEGQNLIGTHSSPNCPKWCWSFFLHFDILLSFVEIFLGSLH
jgi:hypothetical protein